MIMAAFRENPEKTLWEFQNLRDEVASCVSLADIAKKTTSLHVKDEWFQQNSKILTSALDLTIRKICMNTDLENKLRDLHELEKNNEGKAWRPQTGKPELSRMEGHHLEKRKKSLNEIIMQMKEQSALLQVEISDFRKQIEEQQIDIKDFTDSNSQKRVSEKEEVKVK